MKKIFVVFIVTFQVIALQLTVNSAIAENLDSLTIRNIYSEALTSRISYENLRYLCKNIGGRLTGSKNSITAVNWIFDVLSKMNLENVSKQNFQVRNWERGEKEIGYAFSNSDFKKEFNICALGTSVGTGDAGISGKIIEVKSFEELNSLGNKQIDGKIVFFNRPADQRGINTGYGYGSVVEQRFSGAVEVSKYGAIGVIVRSSTVSLDYFPHTGVMRYIDSLKKIPAIGISTLGADELSELLKSNPDINFYFRTTCKENPEIASNNVIGEIKGSEKPDEIIVVGGHIDSWDLGEGAHDDGAGIVQGIEVLRLFQKLEIKPKHTIRFVAFMDEEIDQKGGKFYAEEVIRKNEKHIAAIETDGGAFTPFGFSLQGNDEQIAAIQNFKPLFEPYGLYRFAKGWSGVDVGFLKESGALLLSLIVDSQRYFDYHHSANDVFENVNRREMQLGSASIASLVYLIDKYGL